VGIGCDESKRAEGRIDCGGVGCHFFVAFLPESFSA
jgi:hypothetical protein